MIVAQGTYGDYSRGSESAEIMVGAMMLLSLRRQAQKGPYLILLLCEVLFPCPIWDLGWDDGNHDGHLISHSFPFTPQMKPCEMHLRTDVDPGFINLVVS